MFNLPFINFFMTQGVLGSGGLLLAFEIPLDSPQQLRRNLLACVKLSRNNEGILPGQKKIPRPIRYAMTMPDSLPTGENARVSLINMPDVARSWALPIHQHPGGALEDLHQQVIALLSGGKDCHVGKEIEVQARFARDALRISRSD